MEKSSAKISSHEITLEFYYRIIRGCGSGPLPYEYTIQIMRHYISSHTRIGIHALDAYSCMGAYIMILCYVLFISLLQVREELSVVSGGRAIEGYIAVACFLMREGADWHIKNKDGVSPHQALPTAKASLIAEHQNVQ